MTTIDVVAPHPAELAYRVARVEDRLVSRHSLEGVRKVQAHLGKISDRLDGYAKALRYLATLTDHERLRIVRYNTANFDLDRMRTIPDIAAFLES